MAFKAITVSSNTYYLTALLLTTIAGLTAWSNTRWSSFLHISSRSDHEYLLFDFCCIVSCCSISAFVWCFDHFTMFVMDFMLLVCDYFLSLCIFIHASGSHVCICGYAYLIFLTFCFVHIGYICYSDIGTTHSSLLSGLICDVLIIMVLPLHAIVVFFTFYSSWWSLIM